MKARKRARNIAIITILAVLAIAAVAYTAATQSQNYAKQLAAANPKASNGLSLNPNASASSDSLIYINEIMPGNSSAVIDNLGQYSDWFELYNPNAQPVDLTGWGLSDNLKKSVKWSFPSSQIAAKGYLVIYCTGKPQSEAGKPLHTNFRLSAKGGDTLILMDSQGALVDKLEVPAMDKNMSYGRTTADPAIWAQFTDVTPGYSNDSAGHAQYAASLQLANDRTPTLVINEVMAKNVTTLKDGTGQYPDWVEITNTGNSAVNLKGYGLSDNDSSPLKWQFPDTSIDPGEEIIVYCSGIPATSINAVANTEQNLLHAPFGLSSLQGIILLSDPGGRTIDRVETKELGSDMSYARKNGGWAATAKPTPGYPNTDAGYDQFIQSNPMAKGDLEISQASNANTSTVAANGKYYDWLEIHNTSDHDINLQDYCLTDNTANPAKWHFPSQVLAAGGYTTVFASGLNKAKAGEPLQTNFGIDATAELVALFDKDAKLVDKVPVENLRANMSIGHQAGDAGYYYFTHPMIGAANTGGAKETLPMPVASIPSGRYMDTQKIVLSAEDGAKIYYTTDGSEPTTASELYNGEIPVISQQTQINGGSVPEGRVIRAIAVKDGCVPSTVMTASYFIGVPHTLPLISISTAPKNLFDPVTGIYEPGPNAAQDDFKTGANFYKNTEVPASFEVYDKDGKRVFNQDIALSMAGGLGLLKNQKTLAIHARREYGLGAMQYPFFENRPFSEYKSLVLRTNRDPSRLKETTVFGLVDGKMNVMTQAYKPYVVYLNGKYWGVYYLMEKRNKYMIAAHEGASEPDTINIQKGTKQALKGSNESYVKLIEYVKTHDMTQKASYDYVAARLDADGFMDVMINLIYTANNDYYNMQSYQMPGGKWKQILYDLEMTFWTTHETLAARLGNECNSDMFNGLLKYKPWKDAFIERFAWTLKEIYNPARVDAAIDQGANAIKDEIASMRIKFGDTATVDEWNKAVQGLHTFAKQRPAVMVQQLKKAFSLTDAQKKLLDDAIK